MARAEIVEPTTDDQEFDDVQNVEEQETAQEVQPTPAPEEDDIPDKYRGKSIKEIVQMHQEAERFLGRQGSEVGELRKIVDNFIKGQSTETHQPEPVDFFTDPEKATASAIENHPKVKQAEEFADVYRKEKALTNLTNKHPDMQEIVQDTAFQQWVTGSKIRTKLFQEADQNYDYDAADELFSLWKERQQVVKQTKDAEAVSRKQAVKSASTGAARGTGESSRKVYRRADIIKLMREDPQRYTELSEEILTAYREGRVK